MQVMKYYDPNGNAHRITTERSSFGGYNIFLDGEFYAAADDRMELDDAVRELVTYKKFTHARPRKRQSKTPLVPASKQRS